MSDLEIWDCDPKEMTDDDLLVELPAVARLWEDVIRARAGEEPRFGDLTQRFIDHQHLLIARYDCIQLQLWLFRDHERPPTPRFRELDGTEHDLDQERLFIVSEEGGWYEICIEWGWPSPPDGVWKHPWDARGISYSEYRGEHSAA